MNLPVLIAQVENLKDYIEVLNCGNIENVKKGMSNTLKRMETEISKNL